MDSDIDDDILGQFMDDYERSPKKECVAVQECHQPQSQVQKTPGPEHIQVLSKYFGHQNFRPLQWEIISAIIHDRRDVCAIMSTGYGKSLCFQYPSTFLGGVTLVISPLISLMEDQVLSLEVSNIPACLLGTAQKNQAQVMNEIFENKYTLIYLTPEFCTGDYGITMLRRMEKELSVTLIAIDEAHCISSWGHDFRFQYRKLDILRNIFIKTPIIAVTATATSRVRADIERNLKLCNPLSVCSGFDRPNIYFEVNFKGVNEYGDLSRLMVHTDEGLRFSGPTIIYCITRRETESLADILTRNGLKCRPYHAGMSLTARKETHELFVKDKIGVIVATIAFGMGIDKPDIRNVIHYGSSKSIENYYQEVGRSGRDGQPAHCVTFYNYADFAMLRRLNSNEKAEESLKKLEQYFTNVSCRRRFILEYFEDNVDHLEGHRKSCCDVCTQKIRDTRSDNEKYEGIDENGSYDFTDYAKKLLRAVSAFNTSRFGLGTYLKFLRGSSSTDENKRKHPLFGSGKPQSEIWWKTIARVCIQENYLCEKNEKSGKFSYTAISLTDKGRSMLNSMERIVLPPPSTFLNLLKPKVSQKPSTNQGWIDTSKPVNIPSTSTKPSAISVTILEGDPEMPLYRKLLDVRGELAALMDCMPYMVASNAALMSMARLQPTTLEDLRRLQFDGFTEAKINKFGNKFLEAVTGNSSRMPNSKKRPIKDILDWHPLPDISKTLTVDVSCTMLESGLTVGEIAEKRGVAKSTIVSHLVTGMKFGHNVKLEELGITHETRDLIIQVYREFFCKTGFQAVRLSQMKERCPPEITYDEIKAVLAYLQVRYHLQALNIPYEDYEEFQFSEYTECKIETKLELIESDGKENVQNIKKDFSDLETEFNTEFELNSDHNQSQSNAILDEEYESATKKFKASESSDFDFILDSPPRRLIPLESQESNIPQNEESDINRDVNSQPIEKSETVKKTLKSKKKVLPPWLVVKKIN